MGDPNKYPVVRRSTNVIREPPRQWFVDYLRVTGDNQVELLVDGDAYGKSLHAALQGAGQEVLLTGLHFQPTWRLLRGGGSANADLDHPDIEQFISWKVIEEQKVAALVAGSQLTKRHINTVINACHVLVDGEAAIETRARESA